MFMPNPADVIQAINAATGDLLWEYRRKWPDDVTKVFPVPGINRNLAIYGTAIIDTSADDYVFALDAMSGNLLWETQIVDFRKNAAQETSGPIIANGKIISTRGCEPKGGPEACVITAHDAKTGKELWRRYTIPRPGEPGNETWGDIPYENRWHVGAWMVPSYDPELNLLYVGTSVTSPAPKFMLAGNNRQYLYHNCTLALNADTGKIVWYYQHIVDHWDLDHPFERLLVDTAVRPDAAKVSWINPKLKAGERRKVVTGIPGKTGVVYTLDRQTGEFLWATPTVSQNVISGIDGTGAVTVNPASVFTAAGQERLICPGANGGKNWPAGAYSPLTNTMYYPLQNACMAATSTDDKPSLQIALRHRDERPHRGRDRQGRNRTGDFGRDGCDRLEVRTTVRHVVAGRHRRRPHLRRRRERPVSRVRPEEREGAVGDEPRRARHWLSGDVCGWRPPVRGGEHRAVAADWRAECADAGGAARERQQPVCIRTAGKPALDSRLPASPA